MRIAVISDSHDDTTALAAALEAAVAAGAGLAIHCGDIVSHRTVAALGVPPIPLHLVDGNNRGDPAALRALCRPGRIIHHGEVGRLETPHGGILFTHYPWEARRLAVAGGVRLAACGHTHQAAVERLGDGVLLVNPGTVAGRMAPATFALVDLVRLEASILPTPGRDAPGRAALP